MNRPLALLEAKHCTMILMFLREKEEPVLTKSIMAAIGVQNWATVRKTLTMLEDSGLILRRERTVGRYHSKANLWQLEPKLGSKVASELKEIERNIVDAQSMRGR